GMLIGRGPGGVGVCGSVGGPILSPAAAPVPPLFPRGVDPAPRPLPPACPAASVPVAPPAAADEIRRRFEDQRRDLGVLGGGSLPLGEPARVGSVARSGAEAVAHRGHSPRHRSPVARNGVTEPFP
ncbi:unnamed protein product, partial [Closterium sp. NIES-54]